MFVVVPRDRHDPVVRQPELLRDLARQLHTVLGVRILIPAVLGRDLDPDPVLALHPLHGAHERGVRGANHLGARRAQVEQQLHLARDDHGRVRIHVQLAARGVQDTRLELVDELPRRDHEARGAEQRVTAVGHQRRAAVRLLARHPELELVRGPGRVHEADRDPVLLHAAALLHVDLRVRGDVETVEVASLVDRVERVDHRHAVRIRRRERRLERQLAGEHRAAHHRRLEARPLLVEPVDDREVEPRRPPRGAQFVGDAEARVRRRHHAVGAVESAGSGLRVHVGSREHVGRAGHEFEQAELVADRVAAHGESARLEQFGEPGPLLAVGAARGLAVHAAGAGHRAEPRVHGPVGEEARVEVCVPGARLLRHHASFRVVRES